MLHSLPVSLLKMCSELRLNLETLKFTLQVDGFLLYSQSWPTIIIAWFQNILLAQGEPLPMSSHSPPPPGTTRPPLDGLSKSNAYLHRQGALADKSSPEGKWCLSFFFHLL